jgi:phosphoribosylamine--glycine ligase
MLDGELSAALLGAATGDRSLMEGSVSGRDGAAVGVVVASEGYPETPLVGRPLQNADPASADDDGATLVFHAGTRWTRDGGYETSGGRVVTVVGRGSDLASARAVAYERVADVQLEGAQLRDDIASRELASDLGDRAELGHQAR